jgi:LPXTG-site transpeptidase (sortase) family protein
VFESSTVAAHRDTFFRALRDIRPGDNIVLTTGQENFRYRVVSTKVVDPRAVEVLNPIVGKIQLW